MSRPDSPGPVASGTRGVIPGVITGVARKNRMQVGTVNDVRERGSLDQRNDHGLLGRTDEFARLEHVIAQTRAGCGTVLLVRGEPGVGKTALLEQAAAAAPDLDVVRFRGVESEQAMPYAGLQLLCTTLRADLSRLDKAERMAMESAFRRNDDSPDPFLVGLATLTLLTTGVRLPRLYVVDDAHWLDEATAATLAFVLRRVDDAAIAVLLATQSPGDDHFGEFPAVQLSGLNDADAYRLLRTESFGHLDEATLGRIVAEARGNPGTILQVLGHVRSPAFAAGYGSVGTPPLAPGAEQTLAERLQELDADELRFLMLAAADPIGDPALLWQAAGSLGLDAHSLAALEDHGWLRLATHVMFTHPDERSAVYHMTPNDERRSLHRALADATDPVAAPDRRAFHLACASIGLDEDLAAELEARSADAQRRSGRAGAATFLEHSALLTQDRQLRSDRALAAAIARFDAGSANGSVQMLVTARLGRLDEGGGGRIDRQQARVAFFENRNGEAAELLLRAAEDLRLTDRQEGAEAFLEALIAAAYAGRLGPGTDVVANKTPTDWRIDGLTHRLLVGLTTRYAQSFRDGYSNLVEVLRTAATHDSGDPGRRWLWIASRIAADLWDDRLWTKLTAMALDAALATGSLMLLPYALSSECLVELHLGHLDRAQRIIERVDAVATSTHAPRFFHAALLLAGWRGDEQAARAQIDLARRDALRRGEGSVLTTAALSAAILYNGLGRYDAALEAARDAAAGDELAVFGWALTELVEAAVRTGQRADATRALSELTERTQICGTDWALGIEARSRALVADDRDAEPLYQEAVERLGRSHAQPQLARARLVYGEWLRRRGRRVDARSQLKAARESLTAMGATAFAERAHREYLATSEKVRRRAAEYGSRLTPQETRIATLAREGLTNPEIGERLYLSPRTIEYHLRKIFEKFGITSRRELLLAGGEELDLREG